MEYVDAVRLAGVHARAYARDVGPLAVEFASAVAELVVATSRLAAVLLRPGVAAAVILRRSAAGPIRTVAVTAWSTFASQTPEALAVEAAGGVLILLVALLEAKYGIIRMAWRAVGGAYRAVATSYSTLKRGLREKSRVAAAAFSHVIFLAPVGVVFSWLGSSAHALVQQWGLLPLSCMLPIARTCTTLYHMEEEESDGSMCEPASVQPHGHPRARIAAVHDGVSPSRKDSLQQGKGILASGLDDIQDEAHVDSAGGRPSVDEEFDIPRSSLSSISGPQARPGWSVVRQRRVLGMSGPSSEVATVSRGAEHPSRRISTRRSVRRELQADEAELLRFWSVFGVAWGARTVVHFFAPGVFNPVLVRGDSLLFVFTLWLSLGLTRGADVVFPVLASALNHGRYLRSNASASAEQVNVFLRVLVSLGVLPAERAAVITSSLTESGVVLVGVIFFLTPRPATFLGTVLTGCCVPVYLSAYSATPAGMPFTRQTWLSYWVVYTVLEILYCYVLGGLEWLPLWYHLKLALILWLQVPYYRGAYITLDAGMMRVCKVLSRYRTKRVSPRKRRED